MKNFFKNRTWDDYLAMVVIGIIILGLILFFVGFYGGFEVEGIGGFTWDKINVSKVVSEDDFALISLGLSGESFNLFSLAGAIDPSFGTLYSMVIVSLVGFSLIMLGLAVVVIVIIIGFTYDMIQRRKEKKK